MICILARRLRFLETILKNGAGSGVPRLRREPYRGRLGPRPPVIHGFARAVAAASCVPLAEGQRGSAAGKRHGGAGPGRTGKVRALQARASRLARATEGKTSAPVGAPSTPRSGDDARGSENREKETDALMQ